MPIKLSNSSRKKWTPWAYQTKAAKFLLDNQNAALFLDPGLGKTAITLAAICILKEEGMLQGKVLVLAPLRPATQVWPAEIEKWLDFAGLTYQVLHGPDKDQELAKHADIYIVNNEGLDWLVKSEKVKTPSGKTKKIVDTKFWNRMGFAHLVIDELSKYKHATSGRSKVLRQIMDTFVTRWGLTGSPAANHLMDLFGQCLVIDGGLALGKYITQFRHNFCVADHNGFSYSIRPGAEELIYDRIRPMALRMSAEEYLDMPELIPNEIMVTIGKGAWRRYREMHNDLLTQIGDNEITASNAGVGSMKCRQIAGGAVYVEDDPISIVKRGGRRRDTGKREYHEIHDAKIEALKDLIEELQGEPVLVAYEFQHDLLRINKAFDEEVPYIGKGVSVKKAKQHEDDFNAGRLPYLFAHPQSAGHGLNLQGSARHVCFFNMTWNFENYDQLIRRVWRQGNEHETVTVHKILAKGTIDEMMINRLGQKDWTQKQFFEAMCEMPMI